MRKLLPLCCVAALFTNTAVNAAQHNWKVGVGFDHGFGVTGQLNDVNAFIGNDGFGADYLLKKGRFDQALPLDWYIGAGGYYDWSGNQEVGARAALGVTITFAKHWDAYVQASPALEFDLDDNDPSFKLYGALGLRFSF
nr:hypothetical protein BCCFPMHH_00033 [uncultured bacterium]